MAVLLGLSLVVTSSGPAEAHSFRWGMPSARQQIRPYDYNPTWQTAMDRALSNWNVTPTPAYFPKGSSPNTITARSYSDSWYGRYERWINTSGYYFKIKLNSRRITASATNFSNFVTSVLVHELGHGLRLGHNSGTSIMNDRRNRNSLTKPQQHDIDDVNAYY
ncbi:MAG TPA: hypothetical protein VES42_06510 [Pilimelia sp.]|nr:hypothetical protein [Pilimelia sp.]